MNMFFSEPFEHALITVYGDNKARDLTQAVKLYLPDKDIRILQPENQETLETAAKNSALVIIGIASPTDPNLNMGRRLQDISEITAEIIAIYTGEKKHFKPIDVLARGFDTGLHLEDTKGIEFKQCLSMKIEKGARHLDQQMKEEHHARLAKALSIMPLSLLIFNKDKRALFISDHYFRAYPQIAPRLVQGIHAYDVFQMMAEENHITPEDEHYESVQKFWYTLEGEIEHKTDDGILHKLLAKRLPGDQGIIVMGQNCPLPA